MIGGDITGGHFNPAVTTASIIAYRQYEKLNWAMLYIGAQFLGAALGFTFAKCLGCNLTYAQLMPVSGHSANAAFWAEAWGTFLFVMTILSITGEHSSRLNKTQNYNINVYVI